MEKDMCSMLLTSRRGFVKGAAASCIVGADIKARGFESRSASGLPNPIFAYEFGDISAMQQASFAREYGFEGTVFDHAQSIPERLRAVDGSRDPGVERTWNRRMARHSGE